jgi:prevent-host-death family protein
MALMIDTISQAKAQLSMLVERVQAGEQVIIGKAGKPVAILSPYLPATKERTPGALRGKIQIADDFDQLPLDLAEAFGMESNEIPPS